MQEDIDAGRDHGLPFPKQQMILDLRPHVRHRLYLSGVGGGKTLTSGVDVGETANENPGCTGLYVAPTYDMLNDIVLREIDEIIERASNEAGFRVATYSKSRYRWDFCTGYQLYMRSADRPDKLRGRTVSHVWIDESEVIPSPIYTWNVLLGRLRETHRPPYRIQRYLSVLVTTTPNGPTGIVGLFLQQHAKGDPMYAIVRQRSRENPALDEAFFQAMENTYSEDFRKEQLDAEIVARQGAVYGKTFKRDPFNPGLPGSSGNMIPWEYQSDLPTYVGIDWGHRRPHVLWYQYDERGVYTGQEDTGVVFAEFCEDDVPLDSLIRYLKNCEMYWHIDGFQIDPGGDTSVEGRRSIRRAFPDTRIDFPRDRGDRALRWGIELTKARICLSTQRRRLLFRSNNPPDEVAQGLALDPIVQVDDEGTHRGILCCLAAGYIWRKKGLDIVPDKTGRLYDHGPDALRYLMTTVHRREMLSIIDDIRPTKDHFVRPD